MFDLPPIEKKKVIYGVPNMIVYGPPGIGKTVFLAQNPRTLFLTTSDTHEHVSCRRIRLRDFATFIRTTLQISKAPESALADFDYVVIDDIGGLSMMCEEYCADALELEDIGETTRKNARGAGWRRSRIEFAKGIARISRAKKALKVVLVAHVSESEFGTASSTYTRLEIDVPNYLRNGILRGTVQVLFFTTKDEVQSIKRARDKRQEPTAKVSYVGLGDESERSIVVRSTKSLRAKDQYNMLPEEFPMNWDLYWAYMTGKADRTKDPKEEMKRLEIQEDYWNIERKPEDFLIQSTENPPGSVKPT